MHEKDYSRQIRTTLILGIASISLAGCLESTETEDLADTGPQNPTNSAPVITGSPSASILVGNSYAFVPSATDADGDALTFAVNNLPSWATFDTTTGRLSGQPTLGNVGVYSGIDISVSDGTDSSSLPTFSISVDQAGTVSATLSWNAPTQNSDGTALTDLAGYRVYWGTTPGVYSNSASVNNSGITSYVVTNLTAGTTYEFTTTSFNSAGVESAYSAPISRTVN